VKRYWIVGAEYTDTSFKTVVGGGEEEWAGPFETHEEAESEWSRLSWQAVDNCHVRYRVVERAGDGWRGTLRYWVVGGEYTDTSFQRIAGGGREEWFGPFETFEAAEAKWSRLASETAHLCHARYRVVEAQRPASDEGERGNPCPPTAATVHTATRSMETRAVDRVNDLPGDAEPRNGNAVRPQ
jgi:hypothetical protein